MITSCFYIPLALTHLIEPEQTYYFVFDKSTMQLHPQNKENKEITNLSSIKITHDLYSWSCNQNGEIILLSVRRGLMGFWWQFDRRILNKQKTIENK